MRREMFSGELYHFTIGGVLRGHAAEHPGVVAGAVTASKIKKDRDHRVGQPPLGFD